MTAIVRFLSKRAVSIVLLAVLAVLILIPLFFVFLSAFLDEVPRPGNIKVDGVTLDNFALFASHTARVAIINSVIIGAGSALLAVCVGSFIAFLAARSNLRGRAAIYLVGILPLMLPSYVGALAWGILGNPNAGLLNILADSVGWGTPVNIYGMLGVIFILGLFNAPYAFSLVYGALSLMNPDLEDAATTHGGKMRHVLSNVTLPLSIPALLGAFILVFVLSFENFPVVQMLGAPVGLETMPTMIFRLMNSTPTRGNEAAAIAVALTVFLLLATALQQYVAKSKNYSTVSGKGMKARQFELGNYGYVAWAAVLVYGLLVLVLPLATLLFTALRTTPYITGLADMFDPSKFSWAVFADVVDSAQMLQDTANSIVVSLSAAAIGVVLAFIVSYLIYRTKLKWTAPLEFVSMSPLAVPAIVLGMGLLWTWLVLPIPIYGTLIVLVVAFVAAQMPQGLRGISSSILQVHPELEESIIVHGGTRVTSILQVTAPLMRAGLTSTFILLLMLSMRELTVPLFLFTSDTRLLSIAIFDYFEHGYTAKAAAVSIIYSLIIAILAALSQVFGKSKKRPQRNTTRVSTASKQQTVSV